MKILNLIGLYTDNDINELKAMDIHWKYIALLNPILIWSNEINKFVIVESIEEGKKLIKSWRYSDLPRYDSI